MVYEKGHKKVLGIWFDLVLRVKYSTIPIFKVTLSSITLLYSENFQTKISKK